MVSISTLRRLALALSLGITMTAVAACGGDGGLDSAVSRVCDRAEECELLGNASREDCEAQLQNELEDASDEQRQEAEDDMERCLDQDTCQAFAQCVNSDGGDGGDGGDGDDGGDGGDGGGPGGAAASAVAAFCAAGDQCGFLTGTEAECVEGVGGGLEQATPEQQEDWANRMEQCLALDTCEELLTCVKENDL